MSLSKRGSPADDLKLGNANKLTNLNPNAAEFVPSSLRVSPGASSVDAKSNASGTYTKPVVARSESSVSNNSDEEAHQYWRHQLPDDITPDFKVMGEDESQGLESLTLAGLSLNDRSETSRFSGSLGSGYLLNEHGELSPSHANGNGTAEKLRYSLSTFGEDMMPMNFIHSPSKPWEKQTLNSDQLLSNNRDIQLNNGDSREGFMNDMLGEHAITDSANVNLVEYLASLFPGFAAESLAEVYFTNGCDLSLTVEMLTQLELQVDGSFNHNMSSKPLPPPNLTAMDFPALPVSENPNGVRKYSRDDQREFSPYRSSDKDNMLLFRTNTSVPSRPATDFASIVKKASQNSSMWKDDRARTSDASIGSSIGSSRSSYVLANSYNTTNGRNLYGDKLQSRSSARAAPTWLETGDAVANMYSEMREEARDYARIRNVYFEQARQAYLIGNKALAKELSLKGQVHNMQMKAAHGKAQESIYRQRNSVGLNVGGNGKWLEKLMDLHGLHVSEAIHVLKHELNALRSIARSEEQRIHLYICVGTGHHTRGLRTPARLPVAVQRYLLEEEGLDYTEAQAGLLQVVIR